MQGDQTLITQMNKIFDEVQEQIMAPRDLTPKKGRFESALKIITSVTCVIEFIKALMIDLPDILKGFHGGAPPTITVIGILLWHLFGHILGALGCFVLVLIALCIPFSLLILVAKDNDAVMYVAELIMLGLAIYLEIRYGFFGIVGNVWKFVSSNFV
jgi:hypothetical protein